MIFLATAVFMTLVAVALVVMPLFRTSAGERSHVAGLIAALAIPVAVTLLYATVSSYPWAALQGSGPTAGSSPADATDVEALRQRVERDPQDAAAWTRLGDAYLVRETFPEARDAYRRALELGGADAPDELRLAYAETAIIADRSALTGEAGQLIDEVLSRDPVNPKALWYGGMAALGRGDTDVARDRWKKLLELAPPPQVREIIEQQLARLDPATAADVQSAVQPVGNTRIPVRISITPELASQVRPGAALFLIARAPDVPGPPIAVVRRESAKLPIELEISDRDSMVPGRTLSGLDAVSLTARLANGGEALPVAGDVFGEAVWRANGGAGPLPILIDRVVP